MVWKILRWFDPRWHEAKRLAKSFRRPEIKKAPWTVWDTIPSTLIAIIILLLPGIAVLCWYGIIGR